VTLLSQRFLGGWTSSEAKLLVTILRIWAAYEMVMNAHAAGPSVTISVANRLGCGGSGSAVGCPDIKDQLAA
jgi:hypothetical protein